MPQKPGNPPHLHRAPLSYQNPAFINSPDGRTELEITASDATADGFTGAVVVPVCGVACCFGAEYAPVAAS